MDNNTVNKLIFDSLSSRKSILIDGIGTIVVATKGSRKNNPKEGHDFPHYELTVNNAPARTDLKAVINNDDEYAKWFSSVCKKKGTTKIITIPSCFVIKMKRGLVKNIKCSEELELQFNPFYTKRKIGNKVFKIAMISIISLCAIFAAVYLCLNLTMQSSRRTVTEQKIEIPEKKAYTPSNEDMEEPEDEFGNMQDSIFTPAADTVSVVKDTVEMKAAEPEVIEKTQPVKSEITEPVNGNSYVVVGSFVLLSKAKEDKARLNKIYKGIDIKTTKKKDGKYINYIYTSTSYDDAMNKQSQLSEKYDKINGIWVYQN